MSIIFKKKKMVITLSKIQEEKNKKHTLLLDTAHDKRFNPFIQSQVYSKGGKIAVPETHKSEKNMSIKNNKVTKKNVVKSFLNNEKL
jgi:hypothetical protein